LFVEISSHFLPALHSFDLNLIYIYHIICKEISHTRESRIMDSEQVLLDGTELLIFLNNTKFKFF
jgi:hypothetical protein